MQFHLCERPPKTKSLHILTGDIRCIYVTDSSGFMCRVLCQVLYYRHYTWVPLPDDGAGSWRSHSQWDSQPVLWVLPLLHLCPRPTAGSQGPPTPGGEGQLFSLACRFADQEFRKGALGQVWLGALPRRQSGESQGCSPISSDGLESTEAHSPDVPKPGGRGAGFGSPQMPSQCCLYA